RTSRTTLSLPTVAEIKQRAGEAFGTLAPTSPEFGRLLRGLIPRIVVYPYRLCDGGHPVLQPQCTLRLASLLPSAPGLEPLAGCLEQQLVVDLFEPPQRGACRAPGVAP